MSFLPIREENQEAPVGQTTNAPAAEAPPQTSSSAGAGGEAPKGSATGSPTQFGSSASKLGAYLEANAPQITEQASNIAGNLGQQYQQTFGNIGQAVNQFGEQVKSGYTGFDQGAIDTAIQNARGGNVGEQDVQAIQSSLKNTYQGPAAFEQTDPYSKTQADVMRAAENAQLLTTQPGVKSYYQTNYGQETPGMATLDTALLTGNTGAYGQVKQAAEPFAGLGNYLNQQTAQANLAVPAAQQEIEKGKQYAGEKLTAAEQDVQNQVANALAQRQGAAQSQNASILEGLKKRNASDADLAALGINRDQWNALAQAVTEAGTARDVASNQRQFLAKSGTADIDLSQWLQQQNPNAAITAAGVATPEQLAQSRALQQLAAGQWSGNPLEGVEKVGNAPTGLNQFNYQDALGYSQNMSKANLAAAQAYVDALQAGADEDHAQAQAANAARNEEIAGGIGSAIGSYIGGAYLGPLGYAAGATLGNIAGRDTLGTAQMTYEALAHPSIKNTIPVLEHIATGGLSQTYKTLKKVFCFEGETPIEMADGTTKPIVEIALGEKTRGGEVVGLLQAFVDELYTYGGVAVSGKHAVKENGKWIRVEDSDLATLRGTGQFKVHCLITSNHRIFSHGIEFADYVETDHYEELSISESLEQLNVA